MIPPSLAEKQALSRERQAKHKARQKEKHMGKNNRKEVAKRLTEEIAKTTDPAMVVELSRQLAKVLPKKSSPRKPVEVKVAKVKIEPRPLPITGSALDQLPEEERRIHLAVMEFEKRDLEYRRRTGQKLTQDEKHALIGEALRMWFSEESAALEALNTEKGA